jgi:hypothetical protein
MTPRFLVRPAFALATFQPCNPTLITRFLPSPSSVTALCADELPVNLRSDVSLVLKRDIIHKVPLFQRSSAGFVNALVTYLQPQIYAPDERLMSAGDIGSEMYFIRKGKVRVILPNGEVVAILKEGDHFGEIALLEENSVRTATIKAVGFCDLFVLTKEDLETVFKR